MATVRLRTDAELGRPGQRHDPAEHGELQATAAQTNRLLQALGIRLDGVYRIE